LADRIRAFYVRRGYLDVEVRTELRGAEGSPVRILALVVAEGARVRVTRRSYPCLKVDTVQHLHAGGPRNPGDIGTEIDSYLEEELPGADLLVPADPKAIAPGDGEWPKSVRPSPAKLEPDETYVSDTYERAVRHVQDLYRNEGFLHAEVGPVQILRARCDPRSPPQQCIARPLPPPPTGTCDY